AAPHTRGHIIRAVMEGVAYSLKDTFTIFEEMKIPVTSIRLGGGGARSALWRQIQADVYTHEVEIVAAEEGAAYGAAILAGTGVGAWSSVDEACDTVVRVASRIAPDRAAAKTMKRGYRKYRKIYPALRRVFKCRRPGGCPAGGLGRRVYILYFAGSFTAKTRSAATSRIC